MSAGGGATLRRQLGRQALWLRDSLRWIVDTKMKGCSSPSPMALDVGCGPGFVMDNLGDLLLTTGLDKDYDVVRSCRGRGLDVVHGSAYALPFPDSTFDIVYCTFLLMWLRAPQAALTEMRRVSRGYVASLAEPDFGARIDHPAELAGIRDALVSGLREEGADPTTGRKLRDLFGSSGLDAEIGVHPGVWSVEKLKREFHDEWRFVSEHAQVSPEELRGLESSWKKALRHRTLFQYNPVFFAVAWKGPG